MNHEDCIFCKIINGDIPSAKVYEDEHVYAFLDISQVTKGHTLVIPKTHVKDIFETPPEVAKELYARIPKVANAIKETYQPLGLNTLNNNGEAAEQSVFHLHIHLIPRYGEGDGYTPNWTVHTDDYTSEDLQQIAKEIGQNIQN
ncbi:HIT family protein [Bacilli bacterium]|uniref:Protein hit n=1 Tax=Oceanobacillus caeni TaxID=405946 RepID=A0ABR5MP25_9BACI|nr:MULTISPECIES: HIT family protein [Bacillaceae]KKE79205.1 protein hit [Bacilli bacterium VT-13-104]PZD87697.1 HIT family protein [Bacilli bacterium]KPH79199.1 protein hit [Oceanobacillus caeni]MBU8790372.1 HIT family protein [Oceanobacillus caeni]PZD88928.1 HIT family protein [Bacilli bacterium]